MKRSMKQRYWNQVAASLRKKDRQHADELSESTGIPISVIRRYITVWLAERKLFAVGKRELTSGADGTVYSLREPTSDGLFSNEEWLGPGLAT